MHEAVRMAVPSVLVLVRGVLPVALVVVASATKRMRVLPGAVALERFVLEGLRA